MMTTKTWAKLSVAAIALAAVNGEAFAGSFAVREQSAYYQGLSFAGNGTTGPSISSIFWNPATITGAGDGITFESHNTFIIPDSDIDGTLTGSAGALGLPDSSVSSGDIGSEAWVPSTYLSYKVNEDIFLGLAINAPFGLGTKPDTDWAGQFYSRSSKAISINANPIVGYKVNEALSIALGAQIQYFDVSLKRGVEFSPTFASGELEGDDVGFGVTAGLTFKPVEGTELGLGYRSAISHKLDGTQQAPAIVVPNPAPPPALVPLPASTTDITAKLILPDQVTFSFKQRVNESFRVLGSVEWTNWSRLTAPKVINSNTGALEQTLHFNYDDGWFFALGGEYDYNEDLTLRAGLAYEISPIDDDIRGTRVPDADRFWVSGGLSYNFNENLAFDLGYTHIFLEDADIDIDSTHQDFNAFVGPYNGEAETSIDIISASMRYRWGGPSEHRDYDTTRKY